MFQPYLLLGLEGLYAELGSLGQDWTNLQGGVCQLRLAPPSAEPAAAIPPLPTYLLSGSPANKYLSGRHSQYIQIRTRL